MFKKLRWIDYQPPPLTLQLQMFQHPAAAAPPVLVSVLVGAGSPPDEEAACGIGAAEVNATAMTRVVMIERMANCMIDLSYVIKEWKI